MQIMRDDNQAVWISCDQDGGYYAALFNLSDAVREICFDLAEIGMRTAAVRDVLAEQDLELAQGALKHQIKPHGAELYKIQAL